MTDIAETIQESVENPGESKFNGLIALFVAVVATFMALCNVKDGNVVQAMQQAQAKSIDQWAYYQAKGTKQHIAENTAELFQAQLEMASGLKPQQVAKIEAKITEQKARVKTYEQEKNAIKQEAEQAGKEYDALNVHDDQFDLAEALMSVAIALLGITALTRHRTLLWFGVGMGGLGVVFGFAGFLKLGLHPDFLTRLFS